MLDLIAIIENYIEVDSITANSSFGKDLGLSSFDTVCVVADINKTMKKKVSPQDFIKYKTVGEMSAYLASID